MPPGTSFVSLDGQGRVLSRLLPAIRRQVQEPQGGQHGFDPTPLGLIRQVHLVISPQVAAQIATVSGGQPRA